MSDTPTDPTPFTVEEVDPFDVPAQPPDDHTSASEDVEDDDDVER